MKIKCFLKTIWRSIICFPYIVSGHNYIEVYNNKDIQVLKCEMCNHTSVGFKNK